jgi:hypothetical protein
MKKVTKIRCSNLARAMACGGSLYFEDLPERQDSPPAMEGTAAGELLERLLTFQTNASDWRNLPPAAKNGIHFDSDMKFYIPTIADDIRRHCHPESTVMCEHEVDWPTRSGITIAGHPDATFVGVNGNLYVDDLKYGWKIVDIGPKTPNWQTLGYAIGEVIRRQQYFPLITMRIHQPRPHHKDGSTRDWTITYEQLLAYKEQIEQRCDELAAGKILLQTGSGCKYCEGAGGFCPALNQSLYAAVESTMEFVQDSMDEKALADQLKLVNRIKEIVEIKKSSLEQLAVARIREGKIIPGWITEASLWRSQVEARRIA